MLKNEARQASWALGQLKPEKLKMMLNLDVPYSDSCSRKPQAMIGYAEKVRREAEQAEGDNSA